MEPVSTEEKVTFGCYFTRLYLIPSPPGPCVSFFLCSLDSLSRLLKCPTGVMSLYNRTLPLFDHFLWKKWILLFVTRLVENNKPFRLIICSINRNLSHDLFLKRFKFSILFHGINAFFILFKFLTQLCYVFNLMKKNKTSC